MQRAAIVVPEGKPAYEWVRGRALQKMSPTRRHAVLQAVFIRLLGDWAQGSGWIGSEWRFIVAPPSEAARPLVPDVAYVAAERLAALPEAEREYPPLAPDIVVEILSPGDRSVDVEHKCAVYLAAGTSVVLIVDPLQRTMEAYESGTSPRRYDASGRYVSSSVAGLAIDLAAVFAKLDAP